VNRDVWTTIAKNLSILVIISAFMAFIDPYGASGSPGFLDRWVYWGPLILLGGVTGTLVIKGIRKLFPHSGLLLHLALAPLVISCVITLALILIQVGGLQSLNLEAVLGVYVFVWVIAVALTGIAFLLGKAGVTEYDIPSAGDCSVETDASQSAEAKFLQKLPIKYHAGTLYALQSEDHYLRAHTDKGEELILMRLSDAIDSLCDMDALQTHRSWWVARHGVESVKRSGAKVSLVLKSGAEAAVSRPNVKRLKDAGWL